MLVDFGGSAVIVVSHDRWLRSRRDLILAFDGEGRRYYVGNSDLRRGARAVARRRSKCGEQLPASRSCPATRCRRTDDRCGARRGAPPAAATSRRRSSASPSSASSQACSTISAVERRSKALQARLADPATYQGGGAAAAIRRARAGRGGSRAPSRPVAKTQSRAA
jgi:ATPase subunit of ABC transporter with duplicated ATPase domains